MRFSELVNRMNKIIRRLEPLVASFLSVPCVRRVSSGSFSGVKTN